MSNHRGQATLEYVILLGVTVLFVAFLITRIDPPIRLWWDHLARKVAAPCPTAACLEQAPPTVSPQE